MLSAIGWWYLFSVWLRVPALMDLCDSAPEFRKAWSLLHSCPDLRLSAISNIYKELLRHKDLCTGR